MFINQSGEKYEIFLWPLSLSVSLTLPMEIDVLHLLSLIEQYG